jgi:hypothetical protein
MGGDEVEQVAGGALNKLFGTASKTIMHVVGE